MRSMRFLTVLLVVLVLFVVMPAVVLADNGDSRVTIFSSVRVGPGETINGDVGSIFSSVDVQGTVRGDVFSIFSSVSVSDRANVTGDVFSIFGSVSVSGNAIVVGDAFSIFSSVSRSPTASIRGRTFSAFQDMKWPSDVHIRVTPSGRDWGWGWDREWGRVGWMARIFSGVFSALILAGVGVVVVALFPRRVDVVKETAVQNGWASLGVGFLGLLLSGPLILISIITCIGPFIIGLGIFLSTLLGLVAIGLWVGQRVMDTTSGQSRSVVVDVLVGLLIIGLILAALDVVPYLGWLSGFAWFALFSLSFGAVLLSRWGTVPPAMPPTVITTPPSPMAPPPPVQQGDELPSASSPTGSEGRGTAT